MAAACRITEEKVAVEAAIRCKAVLAMGETVVEEAEMERAVSLLARQKGWVEGVRGQLSGSLINSGINSETNSEIISD